MEASQNPLEHFALHRIVELHLFGFDVSITQATIMGWLVVLGAFGFLAAGASQRALVPGKLQSAAEFGVEHLRTLVIDNIGEKEGPRFVPLLTTLFFFIFFSNLLGLIPGMYTLTSQVMVTGGFALMVYGLSVIVGLRHHGLGFFKILTPPGTPVLLYPLMIPIELISQLARPITLAVRLFANMTAGHTILAVVLGFVITLPLWAGWLPLGFSVLIYLLELLVAFIQAYIFTTLAAVYIGDAVHLH